MNFADEKYASYYFSNHLFQARKSKKLFDLVVKKDWISFSNKFDSSGNQYRTDLNWAYLATSNDVREHLQTNKTDLLGLLITRLTALAWLNAGLGQVAIRVPQTALEAMTRLGQAQTAIRYTENIYDPLQRAEVLIGVGISAWETDVSNPITEKALQQANELLEGLPPDYMDEDISTKGQIILALTRLGLTDSAQNLAHRLDEDIKLSDFDRPGGKSSSIQRTQVQVWASLGYSEKAVKLAKNIGDHKDQLISICRAAELQRIIYSQVDPMIVNLAASLSTKTDDEYALTRHGELLASLGKTSESKEVIIPISDPMVPIWIHSVALWYASKYLDPTSVKSIASKIVDYVKKITASKSRLVSLSKIVLGRESDNIGYLLADLLPYIKSDYEAFQSQLNNDEFGICSLAFFILGDHTSAKEALSKALTVTLSPNDWDETENMVMYAAYFGQTSDDNRLQQIIPRIESRTDIWQKAEILLALDDAVNLTEDSDLQKFTKDRFDLILNNKEAIAGRPITLGVAAVRVAREENEHANHKEDEYIHNAIKLAEKNDDLDDIVGLAHLLARANLNSQAKNVLKLTIQKLHQEEDENKAARVVGKCAQVALMVKNDECLNEIKHVAKEISFEWLSAEALFWLAGWQAVAGNIDIAYNLFIDAMETGLWERMETDDINKAWESIEGVRKLIEEAEFINWPSTKVAILFAILAIILDKQFPWVIQAGLEAFAALPYEYCEFPSIYLDLLVKAVDKVDGKPDEIITLYTNVLEVVKSRHRGYIWAAVNSFMSDLSCFLGTDLYWQMWDTFQDAYKIAE